MPRLAPKRILTMALSLSLAWPQWAFGDFRSFSATPPSSFNLTPEASLHLTHILSSPDAALSRIAPGIAPENRAAYMNARVAELRRQSGLQKTISFGRASARVLNEIFQFQATFIIAVAASIQTANELSKAQVVKGEKPIQNLACGGDDAASTVLCSGEFYAGALGSFVALGAPYASKLFFYKMLALPEVLNPFVKMIFSLSNTVLTTYGVLASASLWTQGVKALPTAAKIQRAKGIFGRMLLERGDSRAWFASEDGQLFQEIVHNMYNIVLLDSDLFWEWMNNTARFGLTPEAGVIMGIAMTTASATSAGTGFATGAVSSALGGGSVVAMGASGAAWVAVAALGTFLGYKALNLFFQTGLGEYMNQGWRRIRAKNADFDWQRFHREIDSYFERLSPARAATAEKMNPNFRPQINRLIKSAITNVRRSRENYVTANLELFYHDFIAVKQLTERIAETKKSLASPAVQRDLKALQEGATPELQQIGRLLCNDTMLGCLPEIDPAQELMRMEHELARAKREMAKISVRLFRMYNIDWQFATSLKSDVNVSLDTDIHMAFINFANVSQLLSEHLVFVTAACDDDILKTWPIQMGEDHKKMFQMELAGYYAREYNEQKVYDARGVN